MHYFFGGDDDNNNGKAADTPGAPAGDRTKDDDTGLKTIEGDAEDTSHL